MSGDRARGARLCQPAPASPCCGWLTGSRSVAVLASFIDTHWRVGHLGRCISAVNAVIARRPIRPRENQSSVTNLVTGLSSHNLYSKLKMEFKGPA